MTATALAALASHWRRQPVQLLALLAGLALATALWSAVQAVNAEAKANYATAAAQLGSGQGDILLRPGGAISVADYVALRRAGWQVSPVLEGRARLGPARVTLMGVDILSYPLVPTPVADAPEVAPLDLLSGPGVLFGNSDTLARLGDGPDLPPRVPTEDLPPGVLLTDIGTAERLLNRQDEITRLMVLPDQPRMLPAPAEVVTDLVRQSPEPMADTTKLTDSFHLNLTAFGLLSFAVGLFIVHGTIGLAFQQRRPMFRTLRALGLPLRHLVTLLGLELLTFALLAGGIGLILGYAVAAALLPDVAATLRGLYGAPVDGSLTLRPDWVLSGLGMALLGTGLAGAQGLWQLTRLPLLAAPGAQAWQGRNALLSRRLAQIGLALLIIGPLTVWIFDGLLAGFVLLGGLLLGGALILPWVLQKLLSWFAARSQKPVAQWVWADMRTQLPGLSLALMALLLALATNIGVGTMVASFRLTFTGWLDQRLPAELYVTAQDDTQGAELEAWLLPRVDAVLPIRGADSRVLGWPTRIYGIVDHPTYADNWPLLAAEPDVWERIAAGEGVLLNEQLARRAGLWPGTRVSLGETWQLPVVGVYSDYGNPNGQAIVSMEALNAQFPDLANRQFGLRLPPDDVPALSRQLRDRFDLPAMGLVDQGAVKAASLRVFDTTFVVTGALNVLTLGVAGFAMLTSLLSLWSARLPQLAPAWAMGLTRAQLARLELWRSLGLAALTALIALPFGLLLAWALLAVINVEAFGWRLPMFLFPMDWLRLGALALLAAAIAAYLPMRRLKRLPPGGLLKVFANER